MRNVLVLCGLFAVGLTAAPARAADPSLVAGAEKNLSDEEKALLAAVLINPRAGAEFDADAREALTDPKTRELLLAKWRDRIAAFAETDSQRPDPNLEGAYRNYAGMLTPQMRAYLVKRVPLMPEDARNELIGYLKNINKSLADNGHLSWYSKKVVSGVMDRYRLQLKEYAATPLAQDSKRTGPAAAAALAQRHAEAARLAQSPSIQIASNARGQADNADRDATAPGRTPEEVSRNAGRAFDGGAVVPDASDGAVAAGPGGAKLPALGPATPGGRPSLVGSVPPAPTTAEEDFMSSLEGQQTKQPSAPLHKYAPAGLGALLLAALGFAVGGPTGALIGTAAGAAIGHFVGKALLS